MNLMQLETLTMTSKEISDVVGSRHDDVKRSIERLASKGAFELPPLAETSFIGIDGRKQNCTIYNLNKRDSIIVVAQLSPMFTAKIVDRWQELEIQVSKKVQIPNFSNPAEAARAWAEQYEARQIAESTKAEIGTKREATAMNTASQAVKKASKLEIQLDKSKEYASIKRMQILYHGQQFQWRHLKQVAIEMQIDPVDIFDQNYGTVKAYHKAVWLEAYALSIE